jgi:hypothetical protein
MQTCNADPQCKPAMQTRNANPEIARSVVATLEPDATFTWLLKKLEQPTFDNLKTAILNFNRNRDS